MVEILKINRRCYKINLLSKLNLKPNYIYETILTTYTEDNIPNAAPMGIILIDNQTVIISPFLSTQTYKNIEKHRCAVINFTYDLEIFFQSTFNPHRPKLPFQFFEKATKINAPRLKKAIAWIEVKIREIQKNEIRARIIGEVVEWDIGTIPFQPINRGFNLVLESIVHTTRVIEFENDLEKVKPLVNLIKQYQRLIKKVAPDGKLVEIIEQIQKIIEKKGLWN